MNRSEIESLNGNSAALKFARPGIAESILSYNSLVELADEIRLEIEPKRRLMILAQSRTDEIEADYELIETIKLANRRDTDPERKETALDKYNYTYSIGKTDNFDLASENDTLTGAIITKT